MKFIKKNWLTILCLLFGLLLVAKIAIDVNNGIKNEKRLLNNTCASVFDNTNKYASSELYDVCMEVKNGTFDYNADDFYYKLDIIAYGDLLYVCEIFGLVLFIITLKEVSSIFKNRTALLMLKRENYKDFLKRIFKSVFKSVWFWPLIMLLIFIVCLIGSDFNYELAKDSYMFESFVYASPILLIITNLISIFLYSITYLNLGLIVVRHQHNYYLAVIESFLLVIAIELFLEIVPGGIIWQKLYDATGKNMYNAQLFKILEVFRMNLEPGVLVYFIYVISLVLITGFIVYLCYRNKEKLIISCEKNN